MSFVVELSSTASLELFQVAGGVVADEALKADRDIAVYGK